MIEYIKFPNTPLKSDVKSFRVVIPRSFSNNIFNQDRHFSISAFTLVCSAQAGQFLFFFVSNPVSSTYIGARLNPNQTQDL